MRVNVNYFISEAVFNYLVEAVRLVAHDGWRLLTDYHFDPARALWRHRLGPVEAPLRLNQISYDPYGLMCFPHHDERAPETELDRYLEQARGLFAARVGEVEQASGTVSADFDELRWFDLPAVSLAGPGA